MEKFIVIVNNKYLVMVEANSHGGAEHRILDDIYYGIEACQAFTLKETSTDTFRALAAHCETISFKEMQAKAKEYKTELDYEAEAKKALEENKARIEALEKELVALRNGSEMLQRNVVLSEQNRCIIW